MPGRDRDLSLKAREVLDACRDGGLMLATVESCTGGLIAAILTEVPGSSAVVERGFVTYSNRAKTDLVGVPADLLRQHGAVSEQVARAMAEGALERSPVDIAVSVTGIAGPDGGSVEKPVGLVHLACARREFPTTHRRVLYGSTLDREDIRMRAVKTAFAMILEQVRTGGLIA